MSETSKNGPGFRRLLVLALFVGVSVAFFVIVQDYLLAVFVAAIFSTILHPVYRYALPRCGGRPWLASGIVLFGFVVAVGVPLLLMLGMVANEAVELSKVIVPWIQQRLQEPPNQTGLHPDWLPFADALNPYREQIRSSLENATSNVGEELFAGLSRATGSTVEFGIDTFVFLYSMFFFLMRGAALFDAVLRYLPLDREDRHEVIERGISVTRATLKSILIIGLLQGVLVGLAFWVVGIKGAVFWGAVVLVMSAIPVLGSPVVWGPAAAWLFFNGQVAEGVGLAIWGAAVVSLVDNILRPRIVGEESRLPDLMILISVLGGIGTLGVIGILVGPVVAAVFVVVLDIYRHTFADVLPGGKGPAGAPPEEE